MKKLIMITLIILFISLICMASLPAVHHIEATFGYTTVGGNNIYIGYVDPTTYSTFLRGTSYTAPYDGILISLHAYIYMPLVEPYRYDLEIGIYEEDFYGNNSHRFVAKEIEKNLRTSGWKTVYNFGELINANTNYILLAIAEPSFPVIEPVSIDLGYDTIGNNRYYEQSGLIKRWTDPWNKVETGISRNYSIYATYMIVPPIPTIEVTFENTQFFMVLLFIVWVCISILGYKKDDVLLLYVQFFVLLPLVLMLLSDAFLKGTVLGYGVGFCLLFSSIYFVLLGTLMARKERTKNNGRKPYDRINS